MELAESYIPIDRRLAMAHGEDLRDRTHGAALFADISGFTPLTEAMAKELGPKRGAEEVTKQLNVVYSALIAEVDHYRGSVIGFSGDAITCWFDADDGSRAITCGLAMQAIMSQFATVHTPAGTTITLAIKVAIASGPVGRFRVGDPQVQYIDVLVGATLDRLAAGEHHASKGEIVASAEAVEASGAGIAIREWREDDESHTLFAVVNGTLHPALPDPWPVLPSEVFAEEQIRPWLLPVIYERLKVGHDQFLAELRPAVALFARFGGIDYDRDLAACEKLDAYIRWVQGIVTRNGGILVQLTIGDKGSYLYSAFGAPIAHDDDPDRAVATALELQAPPTALAYIGDLQIGITRGRMRCGPYGGPTRRTYGVMSDAVNLAARLMSRAQPGEILVSQHIADATSSRYDLRFIGPVMVKGKQAPVLVSQVFGRRAQTGRLATNPYIEPLIGRDAELAQMVQVLDSAMAGKGRILRLEGAAGVGKSHLAAALVEQALAKGMRMAQGACRSATDGTAYAPWRQVFSDLLGFADADADADAEASQTDASMRQVHQVEVVEAFVNRTNRDWLLRLPLLGDLLGLPIPDNATTAAFEARLRQSALFELVVEIVQSVAQDEPLLVLIDDVHLMDEASRGLTIALGRALADLPVALALVHRPPLSEAPILAQLDLLPFHQRLNLNELSPEGVAVLIANRLHGPPDALALSLIQVETQGNPFFVRELLDALRESGNLYRQDGSATVERAMWVLSQRMVQALQQANCLTRSGDQWAVARDAHLSAVDVGLPDSIQGIVLSRIDRLPEAPKLTLKVASVIGPTFSLDVTAHAHPLQPDDDTLVAQANLLEAREFMRLEIPQHRTYVFSHMVTHDVAYETLLFDQRQQLHKAVGDALERLAPDAIPQLAYHTFLGEDWLRALRYQFAAGQLAKRLFANQEGIEHLRKALRCAEKLTPDATLGQRQQIQATLGEMLAITGQYELALEHLQQALALAGTLQDCDAQAHVCRWIAYVHEFRSEYPLALDWIQRGLQALGGRETAATAELLAIAGLINTRQGNYDRALEQCEACIRIAGQLGEVTSLAFAHNSRAIVSYNRGHSADAIEHFKRAAELYRQANNIHGQAMSYNGIGNANQNMGRWSEADSYLREAREIFSQTGDEMHRVFADNNLGEIARNQGRLDEALDYYKAALSSLEKMGGSVYVRGVLHMNLGATFVRCKEIGAAREHLRISQEMYTAVQSRDYLPELHRHLAEAALVAAELEQSEVQGQQALALARELHMRSEEGNALRVLGEIAWTRGALAQAEQTLVDSQAILDEVGYEYEAARSRLSLARVYLSQGRAMQGLAALDQCIATFQRLDATLDLEMATKLRQQR